MRQVESDAFAGEGLFIESGRLFRLATQAYERVGSDKPEIASGADDALVSVLFSAATLEAFVMELQRCAAFGARIRPKAGFLQDLADVLEEAERSRGSVRLKFLLAKRVLPGKPYDKGAQPYQDFDLLFQLRDAIVHLKAQDFDAEPHRLVLQLASRGLCEKPDAKVTRGWLGMIETRAVARWACNVVRKIVDSLGEAIVPNSDIGVILNLRHKYRELDSVS